MGLARLDPARLGLLLGAQQRRDCRRHQSPEQSPERSLEQSQAQSRQRASLHRVRHSRQRQPHLLRDAGRRCVVASVAVIAVADVVMMILIGILNIRVVVVTSRPLML